MSAVIIKSMRTERGLTQAELAKRMRVSQPYVAQLETRGANPSVKTLHKIAKALKCNIWELISE